MTDARAGGYALRLSEAELDRYRMMADAARRSEADLWQAAGIVPGAAVADIGCGPGALFPALVAAIGDEGRVVGVDGDPAAVAQAQSLVSACGWGNVAVQVGQASATALQPGTFDAVMLRHVLAHNGATEQAIVDHVASLVRPGGCVYLVDILESAFAMRPADPDLAELATAYQRFHAAKGNDLRPGIRLDTLLERAGLEVVGYRGWFNIAKPHGQVRPPAWAARDAMVAAGVATTEDIARWDAALQRVAREGPTVFAPLFGAVGRRPA